MSVDLAVWHGDTVLSVKEASAVYLRLCKQKWIPTERHPSVDAFYGELCGRYPEIDTLPEDEADECPWSCAHDRSGLHVIICMNYGEHLGEAAQFVIDLAATHRLICFDPQGPNLYLPPNLKPKRSRFRFW
jgi:hypothetical protein